MVGREALGVKPRSDLQTEDKGPPSPYMVLGFSLLGYPGVGHVMVGKKALGGVIMALFTLLTVGLLYEMYVTFAPVVRAYSDPDALSELSVHWGRVLFWIGSTGGLWLGSGVHAMLLARKAQSRTSTTSPTSSLS